MASKTTKPINPFAALDTLLLQEAEPTGPEWFTVNQFASHYQYSRSHAHAKLRELERTGKLTSWKGRINGISGHTVKYKAT